MPDHDDDLLRPAEAAEFLGLSLVYLAKRRAAGQDPTWVGRGGPHGVRYHRDELERWATARGRRGGRAAIALARADADAPQAGR